MESKIVATVAETPVAETAKITFTRKGNPKRDGSKAAQRFSNYMGSKTVAEYLERQGTKADLKYDWDKGFIEIEGLKRSAE